MELHEALGQISEIRAQMARTQTFGGFRSLTVASSGFLGILAAIYQANRIPRPMEQIEDYVALWSAVAALSLLAVGVELVYSYSAAMSTLRRRLTTHAIRQFVPCLVAGAALNRGDHRSRARDRLDVARIVVFAFRTRRVCVVPVAAATDCLGRRLLSPDWLLLPGVRQGGIPTVALDDGGDVWLWTTSRCTHSVLHVGAR